MVAATLVLTSDVTAMAAALPTIESDGLAAGALFMVELVVGGLATAVATTVVSSASQFLSGLEAAFLGVAALALMGALLATRLSPGRPVAVGASQAATR